MQQIKSEVWSPFPTCENGRYDNEKSKYAKKEN